MKNSTKVKPVRVAFYIRVSTSEQLSGFSLEMQEKDLMDHVERNKYKGWQTKKEWVFSEQGTGGNQNRAELIRMLEAAKKKEFDLVLVWKIDRISRSLTDLLNIFETLNSYDVGFASLKEDIDFTGPIGKLIFQIFGALAEFERETIRMRTAEGKKASARAGNFVGGQAPYGYKKQPNKGKKGSKLVLVKNEVEIVKSVFSWFVNDRMNTTDIARKLNEMGVSKGVSARKNSKYTPWSDNTVRGMLTNETYTGLYFANRFRIASRKPKKYEERPEEEWICTPVDSIVSHFMFMQANELLLHEKKPRGGGKISYMLAGKLVDFSTGEGFVGYSSSSKGKTRNYRRKKFIVAESGEVYRTISIAGTDLENFVWRHIRQAIYKPELFLELHKKSGSDFKRKEALEKQYEIYVEAFSEANRRIERVKDAYYNGDITEAERDERLTKYEVQRDKNFILMKTTEANIKNLGLYQQACLDLHEFGDRFEQGLDQLNYEQKKHIVQMLVDRIEIHDQKNVRKAKVFYRFDPKTLTASIPVDRTDLQVKNKKKPSESDGGGGR